MLYTNCYDVILISESWLSDSVSDGLLDPQNKYYVIRCDRQSMGGGVCAFVSKLCDAITVEMSDVYTDLEICCFDITCKRVNLRCRVVVVYRPPGLAVMPRLIECLHTVSM